MLWAGTASLGVCSDVAGRRAGLRGWSLALAVLFGLAVSFVVLAIQVFWQPGKAISGGVAASAITGLLG